METKETRDSIIVVGLIVLLGILYFAVRPDAVAAAAEVINPNTTPQDVTGPPSYNMPPLLTLPPYNFGNAPSTVNNSTTTNSTGSGGVGCGCTSNACQTSHSASNGAITYDTLMNSWHGISDDNSPGLPAVNMPTISPIIIPPARQAAIAPRHTYSDWYAQATKTGVYSQQLARDMRNAPVTTTVVPGYDDPWITQALQNIGYGVTPAHNGTTTLNTTVMPDVTSAKYNQVINSDIPPGLSGKQTYFLYQQVNGNYLSVLDIHTLNSAVAAAYASPA